MKDMSLSADEAKQYDGPIPVGDEPKYPYGLCLCLNDGSLQKLGIGAMPQVGTQVTITAIATVTSINERQQQDGDKERGMDLQITQMELNAHALAPTETDRANKLYGNADGDA